MPPLQQSQLSSTSVFETDLPYPVVDVEASEKIGKLALAQHPTQKLIVESASELITRSVKTSLFRTKGGENSQLDIVHDGNGQAMIFSIGSDEVRLKVTSKEVILTLLPAFLLCVACR
jgi:hypothetical protein